MIVGGSLGRAGVMRSRTAVRLHPRGARATLPLARRLRPLWSGTPRSATPLWSFMMKTNLLTPAAAAFLVLVTIGCSTAPRDAASRERLAVDVDGTLRGMTAEDPSLQPLLDEAAGYAIFPSVGKGGLGIGGAYGRGHVFRDGEMIGFSDLTQATIGFQAGGQTYDELIVFQDDAALGRFTSGQYSLSANASGVALKANAAKAASFNDGVIVFIKPEGGLMFEASVGGQRFTYKPN
jgi:lipid-binding SYLF domain-containing protein